VYNYIKNKVRSWFPLSQTPPGYWSGRPSEYYNLSPQSRALHGPEQALTLSPFWAALRLYQNSVSVLPLCTYVKDEDGGRHKLEDQSTYNLLHDRPNPAMSRAAFFELLIKDYFLYGECFAQLRWSGNHRLVGMYPIRANQVQRIDCDEEWKKVYTVTGFDEPLLDDEVLHITHFSMCGLRGTPFLRWAAESLSLHKQVLDSATAYYHNAAKPSGYITYPGGLKKEALANVKSGFMESYQGTSNAGSVPILTDGGAFNAFGNTAAADAQIIEALKASVDDIGRWFDNVSPLVLGNLMRGTYSNSAADKLAFFQKNLLPLLEKFQLEMNYKLFGLGSNTYCEFLTDNVLRADPLTQSQVWHNGITDGYLLRSEVRSWLNLSPVEGLDAPMQPLNMGAPGGDVPAVEEVPQQPDPVPQEETSPDA
jgi:HK97 family phage portal protein